LAAFRAVFRRFARNSHLFGHCALAMRSAEKRRRLSVAARWRGNFALKTLNLCVLQFFPEFYLRGAHVRHPSPRPRDGAARHGDAKRRAAAPGFCGTLPTGGGAL
jgi:hypothetical protein